MSSYVQRLRARLASCPALDVPFLAILLILLCYGLIMLFSAGYAVALYRRGDAYTYIRPQLLFAALGVVAMYAASLVDYHIWHKLAWPILGISLVLLVSLMVLPDHIAHYSMAVGAVAGALAEFYSVFIPLRRLGFRFRLTLDFSGHDFRSVISRWIPGSLSSLVAIVSQSVTMYLASSLGTGGLSALSNSIIFYQAPYGIVFSAVQSVFYPQLSAAADERERALRLSSALEYLYTFLLPATLILLPLMQLMIASLLQKGAFSAADTLLTAQVLGWYLAAMVPMSFYAMLQRLLMARGEYRLNLLVTTLVSVLDMVLMIVLMNCGCGISSLSLATLISSTAGAAVLFVRAGDFPWKSFLRRIARITGANALTVILALCYIKWNPQDWLAGSSIVNVMHFVFRAAVMLLSTVLGYVLLRVDFITQLRSRRHGLR